MSNASDNIRPESRNETRRVKLLWDDKESVDLAMNKGAVIKQTPLLIQERITIDD